MEYHEIVDALTANRKFALARYGDGEVMCMGGARGANIDKHRYFGDLGERLQQAVASPKASITYALQGLVRRDKKLKATLDRHSKVKKWTAADVLHHRSWHHDIEDLRRVLAQRNAMCVGPVHLMPLFKQGVIVPKRDCWKLHEWTLEKIRKAHDPGTVWVLCCGMSAAVVIYDLVDELDDVTFLDAGSVFDPYAGVSSRGYHKAVLRRLRR